MAKSIKVGNIPMDDELSGRIIKAMRKFLHLNTDKGWHSFRIRKLKSVELTKMKRHSFECIIKGRMEKDSANEIMKFKDEFQVEKLSNELGIAAYRMSHKAGFDVTAKVDMIVTDAEFDGNQFQANAEVGLMAHESIF